MKAMFCRICFPFIGFCLLSIGTWTVVVSGATIPKIDDMLTDMATGIQSKVADGPAILVASASGVASETGGLLPMAGNGNEDTLMEFGINLAKVGDQMAAMSDHMEQTTYQVRCKMTMLSSATKNMGDSLSLFSSALSGPMRQMNFESTLTSLSKSKQFLKVLSDDGCCNDGQSLCIEVTEQEVEPQSQMSSESVVSTAPPPTVSDLPDPGSDSSAGSSAVLDDNTATTETANPTTDDAEYDDFEDTTASESADSGTTEIDAEPTVLANRTRRNVPLGYFGELVGPAKAIVDGVPATQWQTSDGNGEALEVADKLPKTEQIFAPTKEDVLDIQQSMERQIEELATVLAMFGITLPTPTVHEQRRI